jgi:hypothetical protein
MTFNDMSSLVGFHGALLRLQDRRALRDDMSFVTITPVLLLTIGTLPRIGTLPLTRDT